MCLHPWTWSNPWVASFTMMKQFFVGSSKIGRQFYSIVTYVMLSSLNRQCFMERTYNEKFMSHNIFTCTSQCLHQVTLFSLLRPVIFNSTLVHEITEVQRYIQYFRGIRIRSQKEERNHWILIMNDRQMGS